MAVIDLRLDDIKYPISGQIMAAFGGAFGAVNEYPNNYDVLVSKLASKYDIDPSRIILLNSIAEGCDLLARSWPDSIVYFVPTNADFERAAIHAQAQYKRLDALDGHEYKIDLKTPEIEYSQLIFLANPNRPFGTVSLSDISLMADKAPGIIAVDESYIRYGRRSAMSLTQDHDSIVVMRSFSQEFSAAGLGLAYLVSSEDIVVKLKRRKVQYSVASPAVQAGLELLDYDDYFKQLCEGMINIRKSFEPALAIKGFDIIDTRNHNILVRFDNPAEAENLRRYLATNDILVNQGDSENTVGVDKNFVLFTCGTKEQMKQVGELLKKY